jgi:hypothetical protein
MHHFDIYVRTFRQVQDFVALAMVQPFEVMVGSDSHMVNGKSFMGMFTLDYSHPLQVCVKCSDEDFGKFRQATANIFV